ncbi:uncharacterized protein LOC106470714 [Limulus polyphemus]|uniref:Uncharacterized protein LOC106470714 n=1 Tax=Limulus polyphemus TaxID=6850 RepID=A0ABM1BQJ6_LIMPO|nr:uncharacterized protein LOC106470714 [Limulus polyphemus]XP_022255054.1 uncharacterized protein LOC106470714 [Limulus polyphemus]
MIPCNEPTDPIPSFEEDGFPIRYLGSTTFNVKGKKIDIQILQRPLLELYSKARRRGEDQRAVHPLGLNQILHVSDYGLVVAESNQDHETGDAIAVVTKVLTPVSSLALWAAVRFHTRVMKRKAFGAAFVPLACSEAVVNEDQYTRLANKQRFLVSLTHPSLFTCLFRRVASPKSVECHAFLCSSAEDAMTICSILGDTKQLCERVGSIELLVEDGISSRASDFSGRYDATHLQRELTARIETPSLISHSNEPITRNHYHKEKCNGSKSQINGQLMGRRFERELRDIPSSPDSGRRYVKNNSKMSRHKRVDDYSSSPSLEKRERLQKTRSKSCERRASKYNTKISRNSRSKSCERMLDESPSSPFGEQRQLFFGNCRSTPGDRREFFSNLDIRKPTLDEQFGKYCSEDSYSSPSLLRKHLKHRSKSAERIANDISSSSDTDGKPTTINRSKSAEGISQAAQFSTKISENTTNRTRETEVKSYNQEERLRPKFYTANAGNLSSSTEWRWNDFQQDSLKSLDLETEPCRLPEHERRYIQEVIRRHTNIHGVRPNPKIKLASQSQEGQDSAFRRLQSRDVSQSLPNYFEQEETESTSSSVAPLRETTVITRTMDFGSESDARSLYGSVLSTQKHPQIENLNRMFKSKQFEINGEIGDFKDMRNSSDIREQINHASDKHLIKNDSFSASIDSHYLDSELYAVPRKNHYNSMRKGSKKQGLAATELVQDVELGSKSECSYSSNQSDNWQLQRNKEHNITRSMIGDDNESGDSQSTLKHEKHTSFKTRDAYGPEDVHEMTYSKYMKTNEFQEANDETLAKMKRNGTTKVVINVPYKEGLSYGQDRTNYIATGIRTFHKHNNVKNWSTMSQGSEASYKGSITHNGAATLPLNRGQQKSIRFSSDDHLNRKPSFLASFKRMSLKSLKRARKKFASFRTKKKVPSKRKKECEISEDSAYDTSEVCLSPNGGQIVKIKNPERSWSFQDLPTEHSQSQGVENGSSGSQKAQSSKKNGGLSKKRFRRLRRRGSGSSLSYDSGVDDYHSDHSIPLHNHYKSDSELNRGTTINIRHGISERKFQHWSQTDLADELGYIP